MFQNFGAFSNNSPKQERRIDIFLSSPSDVQVERDTIKSLIGELNSSSISEGYHLRSFAWEDNAPAIAGQPAQKVIDNYGLKADQADIFICVLWGRIGTPFIDKETGNSYRSGTHYEFHLAYDSNKSKRLPVILLYRCRRALPVDIDVEQLKGVQDFFKEFIAPDAELQGLVKYFETADELRSIIRENLYMILRKDFPLGTPANIANDSNETTSIRQEPILSRDDMLKQLELVNSRLRKYRCTIANKYEIPRIEVPQIAQWLQEGAINERLGVLIDKPGTGKTGVMIQVMKHLELAGNTVLAIKVDSFPLRERTWLETTIIDKCIKSLSENSDIIILIDQIDSLSVALSQDFEALDFFNNLVFKLISLTRVRVLVSCREFDLEFDPAFSELKSKDYRRFVLSPLTNDEIITALDSVGVHEIKNLATRMVQLLSLPLHLNLFVNIVLNSRHTLPTDNYHSVQQLYDELWRIRIDAGEGAKLNLVETIYVLVDAMQEEEHLAVPVGVLDADKYSLAKTYLQRIDFIRQESANYIFSHQTLFDYCYARRFVADRQHISLVILESSQGLFERSQMLQVLAYLRASNEQRFILELRWLLTSEKLKPHLRILLIEWFAALINPSDVEVSIARQLLSNEQDAILFFQSAQKNAAWFDKLNDGFLTSLLQRDELVSITEATVSYLSSVITERREQVVNLLLPYEGRSEQWNTRIEYCLFRLEDWNDH